jgi:hypothetical protein
VRGLEVGLVNAVKQRVEDGIVRMWLLLWFVFIPDVGIKYYHLGTYTSETICKVGMSKATILAYDKTEALECIYVDTEL